MLALRDYVRYSGDRSIIKELYPNIVAGVDGALAHWWTATATWSTRTMKPGWTRGATPTSRRTRPEPRAPTTSRRCGTDNCWRARSSRPSRATPMRNGVGRKPPRAYGRILRATSSIRQAGLVADHLAADDKPDFTLRRTRCSRCELVPDEALAARVTRNAWQSLVYPWGVATLDQNDPFFHPYHLAPGLYHKDEAYHNGTVWPWLNGIAMQRMIEYGQVELAWSLFRYNDELALSARRGRRPARNHGRLSAPRGSAATPHRHVPAGVVECRAAAGLVPVRARRAAGHGQGRDLAGAAAAGRARRCRLQRARGRGNAGRQRSTASTAIVAIGSAWTASPRS